MTAQTEPIEIGQDLIKPVSTRESTVQPGGFGIEKRRAQARRPLTDEELPDAESLGQELRSLRLRARLSQVELVYWSSLSSNHVFNLEHACRRTRHSTLLRIARVLVDHLPDYLGSADDLAEHLVQVAGAALAHESGHPERVERRRQRRAAKVERRIALALPIAEVMAKEMFDDYLAQRGKRRVGRPLGSR